MYKINVKPKLSKHFIYNWLRSDLFGEFTLYKNLNNRLTRSILKKVWKSVISYRNFKFRKNLTTRSFVRNYRRLYSSYVIKMCNFKSVFRSSVNLRLYTKNFTTVINRNKKLVSSRKTYRNTWDKIVPFFRFINFKFFKKSRPRRPRNVLHLNFSSTLYVPKIRKVKKAEKPYLRKYHVSQFFGLQYGVDPHWKRYFISSSNFINNASRLEFQFSNILVRAGFVDSGYVAQHLLKKGVFAVNGYAPRYSNFTLHPWDIVSSINSTVWWALRAKFFHFLEQVKLAEVSPKKVHTRRYLRRIRKRGKYSPAKVETFFKKRSLFYAIMGSKNFHKSIHERSFKTFMLNPVPKYMEISYRLLLVVIHRQAYRSDINVPFTIKSLKCLIKNRNPNSFRGHFYLT